MTELLLSKLLPPRMEKDLIERQRLFETDSGIGSRKITLLTAPAGYGKTVSMFQFAQNTDRALVWLQLDSYDNDPVTFIQYLVAGIQRQFPSFGKPLLPLAEQGNIESRLRLIVTLVINGLLQLDRPLLLVLDDFHVITEPSVLRFTQELLEYLPDQVRALIASRTMPPLTLTRLKLANEVLTVGVEEFRFTPEETRLFLIKRSIPMTAEAEFRLDQEINGWPALLRLAVDSGSPLQNVTVNTEIYEYLAIEVLARFSEPTKEYILKTSVLESITAEDCDLLLQRQDSSEMLKRLEKENLFLVRLSGSKRTYRYHQLFREFLLERLGPERPLLQRAAGFSAQKRGDWAMAVEYFIAAGAEAELQGAFKEAAWQAFRQGRWQTVQRWLEYLTIFQINANPWLSLFKAQVEAYRGRMDSAAEWVERAVCGFAPDRDQTGPAECRLLKARIMRYKGFYQQSLELLQEAYPYLQTGTQRYRFDLPLEKSLSLVMTGRFKEAEVLIKGALTVAEQEGDNGIIANLLEGLGNTYYLQGEYAKALHTYHQRREIIPERNFPDYYTQDYIAAIYQEWGELEQAYEYARRNVDFKENFGLTETLPSAYFQLADIYLNRGELKNAEEYFRRAIELIERTSEERFYLIVNKAYLARCLSVQGRIAEAQALVEETLKEAQVTSGLALAICQELGAPIFWSYGKKPEARAMLAEAITTLETMGFPRPLGHAYAAAALFCNASGAFEQAAAYSRKTLELSARKNFCQSFIVAYNIFQPILQFGLEHGVEVVFIQKVLARLGKKAIPLISIMARHSAPDVRGRVLIPLAEAGTEEAASIIAPLTVDPDLAVSQAALETLAKFKIHAAVSTSFQTSNHILELKTLGPFQLLRRGEIISLNWRTSKARDLLVYLAYRGEATPKEIIMEDLWPDYEPEKAKGLLHTSIYYLRQVFKNLGVQELISYRNNCYELAFGTIFEDRRHFQELVNAGFQDGKESALAAELLEEAVELYRGDYLTELDYPWLLPYQENLKNLCCEARLWLGGFYLRQKNYHRAISHLRALTGMDPLSEAPRRLMMTAYAGLGDRGGVQKEYLTLQELLGGELGLAPSGETRDLYFKLLQES